MTIRGRTPGEGEGTGDGVQGGTIRWWIQGDQLSQPHFDLLPVLDMIVAFLTGSPPPVRMAEWPGPLPPIVNSSPCRKYGTITYYFFVCGIRALW